MEDLHLICLLLDFYGQLLTERQYEVLDLHYNCDYSFGEISKELNITRQAVFDNAKRGKETLIKLEEKLSLVNKFSSKKDKAEEILLLLEKIDMKNISFDNNKCLENIRKCVISIIKD